MRTDDVITLSVVASALALGLGGFALFESIHERAALPRLHVSQCFVFGENLREPWEVPVDGIIRQIGQTKYLWEPWPLAQPNQHKKPWRLGREYGITSDIHELDSHTAPADCPWEKE
jgi:hypothetical protein